MTLIHFFKHGFSDDSDFKNPGSSDDSDMGDFKLSGFSVSGSCFSDDRLSNPDIA